MAAIRRAMEARHGRSSEPTPRRIVAGPQLPSDFVRPSSRPSSSSRSRSNSVHSSASRSSSSSDGEGPCVGPALPDASSMRDDGLSDGVRRFVEREARQRAAHEEANAAAANAAISRPEWMLLPPWLSNASSLQAVAGDALKLKSRGFAQATRRVSARAAAAAAAAEDADTSLWTETPEERLKRMQDEVSGVKSGATSGTSDKAALETERAAGRDAAIAASVAEARGTKSLVELHNQRRRSELKAELKPKLKPKLEHEQARQQSRSETRRSRDDEADRKPSSSRHGRHSRHGRDEHDTQPRRRRRRRSRSPDASRTEPEQHRSSRRSDKQRAQDDVRSGQAAAPLMWEREAALSMGGRLMHQTKRSKLLADANALGDRFGSGTTRFL